MSDWRDSISLDVVQICRGEGISYFRRDEVQHLINLLVIRDKSRPKHKRSNFSYLATYSDVGMTRLLNLIERDWDKEILVPMSLQTVPQDSVHRLECVITLKLDKDNYDPATLVPVFKDYLIQYIEGPFDCLVVKVSHVFGQWYDIHVRYSCNLIDAYTLLTQIPWVKDGVVRPVSEFGKRTLSIPE